jgi:hypothetical protein
MGVVQLWWGLAGMAPSGTGSYSYWSNFHIVVENIAYQKVVGIWGRSEAEAWKFHPAAFDRRLGGNQELWTANISTPLDQFVVKYQVAGLTYWDNNGGYDYHLDSTGAHSTDGVGTAVISPNVLYQDCPFIDGGGLHVGISLQNLYYAKHVGVRWTTNRWATFLDTLGTYNRSYEPAGLPHQPQVEAWSVTIPKSMLGAKSIEFAVFFDNFWDDNFGRNYEASTVEATPAARRPSAKLDGREAVPAWTGDQKRIAPAATSAPQAATAKAAGRRDAIRELDP